MSRGRGGRGGQRGGRPMPGTARIGGIDIAYDEDISLDDRPKPTPLFPPRTVTPPSPLTASELSAIAHYRSIRSRIHSGPLYTVLGEHNKIKKPRDRVNTMAAHFDPFEGMETYSQRYKVKARRLPNFAATGIKYELRFFPEELWSTLEASSSKGANGTAGARRKAPLVVKGKGKEILLDGLDEEEEPVEGSGTVPGEEDQVKEEEEEVDDEYASDEDEMAGDYNAEQYFDDGGDDAGEDYDGGGGDGDGGEY